MKTKFIPAKVNLDFTIPASELKKIPKKVGIVTTVQHIHQIKDIQKQLPQSIVCGQVLGCNANVTLKTKGKVDAYLYVGSGFFHPIAVALQSEKPVYKYHPILKKVSKVLQKEIDEYQKNKRVSLIKFLSARRVGILVSTKPGQNNFKLAQKLAKRDDDKQYYIFAFDTLSTMNMEDFNFIEMWVDTACPRIADEKKNIIGIHDVFLALSMTGPKHQSDKQF